MSVEMEMHIDGLPELREKLNRLDGTMRRKVHDAMQFEAEAMKNMARARCPVRTGQRALATFFMASASKLMAS